MELRQLARLGPSQLQPVCELSASQCAENLRHARRRDRERGWRGSDRDRNERNLSFMLGDRDMGVALGAAEHLTKPIDPRALLELIDQL